MRMPRMVRNTGKTRNVPPGHHPIAQAMTAIAPIKAMMASATRGSRMNMNSYRVGRERSLKEKLIFAAIFCSLVWLGLFSSASETVAALYVLIGSYAIALLIDYIWSAKVRSTSQASRPESGERGFQFPAE